MMATAKARSRLATLGAYALVAACLLATSWFVLARLDYEWNWVAVYAYRLKFIHGWNETVRLSIASLGLSCLFGAVVAVLTSSAHSIPRAFGRTYVEVVRGTPLLVQILVFFYVLAHVAGLENRWVAGVLSLSFFSGAYMSEIFRAGLASVGRTERDTARALGLTKAQTLRFVVVPQALRVVLPPLAGQFVSLIKDSSLLSVIAISELTLNAQEVNSFTYSALESYLPLAVGYLALTLPLSLWIRNLERRVHFET